MDDLISRQQAIDALRGYLVEKRCPDDGTLTCRLIENEVINKLPPAEPKKRGMSIEQEKMIVQSLSSLYPLQEFEEKAIHTILDALPRWIPCSEGLPKEEGFYLVTLGYKHGAETNIRYFKIENGMRYWSRWGNENITAWMPKPEPYKGVTE